MGRNSRIAIMKNGVDLLRIMPRRKEDGKFDIVFAFIERDCEVYAYRLMCKNPDAGIIGVDHEATITYHYGEGGRKPVVHVKRQTISQDGKRYRSLPLKNVTPPSEDVLVPLPLVKVEFPSDLSGDGGVTVPGKCQTGKKSKGRYDLEIDPACSCIEVYLLPKGSTFDQMRKVFPGLEYALLSLPFESWSSAVLSVNESKRGTAPYGMTSSPFQEVVFHDVRLLIVQYPEPFMPLPAKRLRLTFVDNELAESVMLHAQVIIDLDNNRVLTALPSLDNLELPAEESAKELRDKSLWVEALRAGRLNPELLESASERVELGRIALQNAMKTAKAERAADIRLLTARLRELGFEKKVSLMLSKESSFDKHYALAQALDSFPALVHVTKIEKEALGICEWYAFLSLAKDVDIHLDIARICAFANVPCKEMVQQTEGRPFCEGLAGLRTALDMHGFSCSITETYLLQEYEDAQLGVGVEILPLYAVPSCSGSFGRGNGPNWVEHPVELTEDDCSDLKAVAIEAAEGPGLYLFDMQAGRRIAEGASAPLTIVPKGRISDEEWQEILSAFWDVVKPYSAIRTALSAVDNSLKNLKEKCDVKRLTNRINEGEEPTLILAEANFAVVDFTVTWSWLSSCLDEWALSGAEHGFPMRLVFDEARVGLTSFWADMREFSYNNTMMYTSIGQTVGVGSYLKCPKSYLLRGEDRYFSQDTRAFIDEIAGDVVDLVALAEEAVDYAQRIPYASVASHIGSVDRAAGFYLKLWDERGFEGGVACIRIGEEGITPETMLDFEYLPVDELSSMIELLRPLYPD